MADNQIYKDNRLESRDLEVGSKVAPGTPVLTAQGPGVTLTGSGDYQRTAKVTLPDGTEASYVSRVRGGVGLADEYATVAFSGSFYFVFPGSDVAEEGDVVVIDEDGSLAISDGSDTGTRFGVVDFVRPVDGSAVVKIGV